MVEFRTHSERIVRDLKRGEHMILSYRGEPLAENVPFQVGEHGDEEMSAGNRHQPETGDDALHGGRSLGEGEF